MSVSTKHGCLIDLCIDADVNLIDTADVYSAGTCEEIVGEARETWPGVQQLIDSLAGSTRRGDAERCSLDRSATYGAATRKRALPSMWIGW